MNLLHIVINILCTFNCSQRRQMTSRHGHSEDSRQAAVIHIPATKNKCFQIDGNSFFHLIILLYNYY